MVGMSDEFESETERLLCHLYQIVYSDLNLCGCGWPDEAIALIHELLTAISWGRGDGAWQKIRAVRQRLLPTPALEHLVISLLDHADLTDHGTSIRTSWLTDHGKWFLWAVEQVGGVEGLDDRLCEVGYPHPWDPELKDTKPCTDACWAIPEGWEPPGPEPVATVVPAIAEPAEAPCVRCLYGTPHRHEEAIHAS